MSDAKQWNYVTYFDEKATVVTRPDGSQVKLFSHDLGSIKISKLLQETLDALSQAPQSYEVRLKSKKGEWSNWVPLGGGVVHENIEVRIKENGK